MKQVIRIPEDKVVNVISAYYDLPIETIKADRNGRKRQVRTSLVTQNGRHVICRDVGLVRGNAYWDTMPVDKIVCTDFENRIHLRKAKKIPQVQEISAALRALGYPAGMRVNAWMRDEIPNIVHISMPEEDQEWIYDLAKHTFVE